MTLAIVVDLPDGRYEAGDVRDAARVEWPPHPGRLHAALRASSCTTEHDRLLRWLETVSPPEVWAPLTHDGEQRHTRYVVTGRVTGRGGSQTHPARTSQERQRASAFLGSARFAFVWPVLEPSQQQWRMLRDLIRRVPYWGRSSAPVRCSVTDDLDPRPEWVRFVPAEAGERTDWTLRVAFPGLTDELEKRYDEGGRPWEGWESGVSGERGYRVLTGETPEASAVPVASGHEAMAMFALPAGMRVDGIHGGVFAASLRDTVMKIVPDPPPPEVSGHGVNGKPHVAYVPLPDTGHGRARGHLLGAGVFFPRGKTDLATTVTGVLLGASGGVRVRHAGMTVTLQPFDAAIHRSPRLDAEWWSRPSRSWVTVTPLVLDRFCGRNNEEQEIARHCELLGLPRPTGVLTSRSPLVSGGAALRRRQLARPDERRPFTHARIEFPVPVVGPLVLGAQRHVGMGLCAPETEKPR